MTDVIICILRRSRDMYFSPTKLSRPIVLLRAKNWHVNIFFYERAGDLFVFDI